MLLWNDARNQMVSAIIHIAVYAVPGKTRLMENPAQKSPTAPLNFLQCSDKFQGAPEAIRLGLGAGGIDHFVYTLPQRITQYCLRHPWETGEQNIIDQYRIQHFPHRIQVTGYADGVVGNPGIIRRNEVPSSYGSFKLQGEISPMSQSLAVPSTKITLSGLISR